MNEMLNAVTHISFYCKRVSEYAVIILFAHLVAVAVMKVTPAP
jgi:hypothetical protein